MMESLGFSETTSVSYVTPVARGSAPTPVMRPQPRTQHLPPPDPNVDSVADWKPIEVDNSGLNRRTRWSLVFLWLVILGIVGGAAYWFYENPTITADQGLAVVRDDASKLGAALDGLEQSATTLIPGEVDTDLGGVRSFSEVDEASRALFTSSADLAERDAAIRLAATDASTQALDASRTVNTTRSYLAAVATILTAPILETDPEAIDLATAATDFGAWISRFDEVRNALPESILSTVSSDLDAVSARLETFQRGYLDALREDDRVGALDVVRSLEGRLIETWTLLNEESETVRASILDRIDSARKSLDSIR